MVSQSQDDISVNEGDEEEEYMKNGTLQLNHQSKLDIDQKGYVLQKKLNAQILVLSLPKIHIMN